MEEKTDISSVGQFNPISDFKFKSRSAYPGFKIKYITAK
jgi:hypothetical protein